MSDLVRLVMNKTHRKGKIKADFRIIFLLINSISIKITMDVICHRLLLSSASFPVPSRTRRN